MLADDHFFTDALGAGGAEVVLPDHVQHRGAGDAGQAAGLTGAQRNGRQDQMDDAAAAAGGEPAQLMGEEQDQQQAQPEARHGQT